jgi:hypothetical protein
MPVWALVFLLIGYISNIVYDYAVWFLYYKLLKTVYLYLLYMSMKMHNFD